MRVVCIEEGRKGRDTSGVCRRLPLSRGELICGEGSDEADTNVSLDSELEDLRTIILGLLCPTPGLVKGVPVLGEEGEDCVIGFINGGPVSNMSVIFF